MSTCGLCGNEIHRDGAKRHYGDFIAHEEYRCRELLQSRIADLESQVAALVGALEALPCACKRLPIAACPQCGGRLEAVTYPSDSMLNREQFDSVRAGDWYCTSCKGTEASSGYKYWWNGDLGRSSQQCPRCTALADLPAFAKTRDERLRAEGAAEAIADVEAREDQIIRETLLEVISHAHDGMVSVESVRAMEAAIEDLPVQEPTRYDCYREALRQIEELTFGGKGQSAVNMLAQTALNNPEVFAADLAKRGGQ